MGFSFKNHGGSKITWGFGKSVGCTAFWWGNGNCRRVFSVGSVGGESGSVYVGKARRSFRSRKNSHRSAIRKGGQSLLHRNFYQAAHSVDEMRVPILEKVYRLYWINELGTATPHVSKQISMHCSINIPEENDQMAKRKNIKRKSLPYQGRA